MALWGDVCERLLGEEYPYMSNLDEEGDWVGTQILLGFDVNLGILAIHLLKAEIMGNRQCYFAMLSARRTI